MNNMYILIYVHTIEIKEQRNVEFIKPILRIQQINTKINLKAYWFERRGTYQLRNTY